jgi:hypothetical protein
MMNIYNGNVTTDANGYATVTLPAYFEALNKDFRYQLTVIGSFARAMVAKEVSHNQFTIRTDSPNVKVSWQVTGIRHDAFANAHRIRVIQNKTRFNTTSTSSHSATHAVRRARPFVQMKAATPVARPHAAARPGRIRHGLAPARVR